MRQSTKLIDAQGRSCIHVPIAQNAMWSTAPGFGTILRMIKDRNPPRGSCDDNAQNHFCINRLFCGIFINCICRELSGASIGSERRACVMRENPGISKPNRAMQATRQGARRHDSHRTGAAASETSSRTACAANNAKGAPYKRTP